MSKAIPEPRNKTIQVRVTASEKERLTAKAAVEKETVSNLIYPAIKELLLEKAVDPDLGFLDD